jgi:hypothetical protein
MIKVKNIYSFILSLMSISMNFAKSMQANSPIFSNFSPQFRMLANQEITPITTSPGFQVQNANQINNRSYYCLRTRHSNKTIILSGDGKTIVQSESNVCDFWSAFRLIRKNNVRGHPIIKIQNVLDSSFLTLNFNRGKHSEIFMQHKNHGSWQEWRVYQNKKQDKQRTYFRFQNVAKGFFLNANWRHNGLGKINCRGGSYNLENLEFYLEVWKPKPVDTKKHGFKVQHMGQVLPTLLYCIRSEHANKTLVPDKDGKMLRQSNNSECDNKSVFQIIRVPSEQGRPVIILKNEFTNRIISIDQRINQKQSVILEPMNSSVYQTWRVLRAPRSDVEKTLFNFQNVSSNKFLEVEEGNRAKAKIVVVDALHNLGHQSFYLEVWDPEVAKAKAINNTKISSSVNANANSNSNGVQNLTMDAPGFMVQEISQLKQNLVYCLKSSTTNKAIAANKNGQFLVENNSQFCGERSRFQIFFETKENGRFPVRLKSLYYGKFIDLHPKKQIPHFVILKNQENSKSQKWGISNASSSNGGTGVFRFENLKNGDALEALQTKKNWNYMITSKIIKNKGSQLFRLQVLGEMPKSYGHVQKNQRNRSNNPYRQNSSSNPYGRNRYSHPYSRNGYLHPNGRNRYSQFYRRNRYSHPYKRNKPSQHYGGNSNSQSQNKNNRSNSQNSNDFFGGFLFR